MWHKVKLAGAVLLTVLVGVVIAQNTEPVETRVLFATVALPRAVLLLLTLLAGFALGVLGALLWSRRKPKE